MGGTSSSTNLTIFISSFIFFFSFVRFKNFQNPRFHNPQNPILQFLFFIFNFLAGKFELLDIKLKVELSLTQIDCFFSLNWV